MADSDHECDKTTPKKPKILKKVYKQKFRAEWMSDPAFKSWRVAPKSANDDPSCKFCTKKFPVQKLPCRDIENQHSTSKLLLLHQSK